MSDPDSFKKEQVLALLDSIKKRIEDLPNINCTVKMENTIEPLYRHHRHSAVGIVTHGFTMDLEVRHAPIYNLYEEDEDDEPYE